jgi:hypothetical protein
VAHEIRLAAPRVEGPVAYFEWTVDPPTPLYRRTAFQLAFPEGIDLTRVPERAWWWVMLMVLHPHWALLRPCRVYLPVDIGEAEREFWLRLADMAVATVETYRGGDDFDRTVELVCGRPELPPMDLPQAAGPSAAAFSGGKDSLLQAALLCELGDPPLLVTVTSPLPPMEDHVSPRRAEIMAAVPRRRPVEHIDARSDLRAAWENLVPREWGYPISTNELTDTLLYLAALLVVGIARGSRRLFMASEVEVNSNAVIDGRFVQHPHFMYSVVTLGALNRLFARAGTGLSSLTPPLYSGQVQSLLWNRYPDLSDLQFSCWNVTGGSQMCSSCSQCLRIAFVALADGKSPARIGLDLRRLLETMSTWRPKVRQAAEARLPQDITLVALHGASVHAIRAAGTGRVLRELLRSRAGALLDGRTYAALRAYRALRHDLGDFEASPPAGFRAGMLRFVDAALRERVLAIYAGAYPEEPAPAYMPQVERAAAAVDWITESLDVPAGSPQHPAGKRNSEK